jgi:hypothetical protein
MLGFEGAFGWRDARDARGTNFAVTAKNVPRGLVRAWNA